MLVVLLAVIILYRWWKREKDLQNMSWKIDYNDLNFSLAKRSHSTHASGRLTCSTNSIGSHSIVDTIRSEANSALTSRHSIARAQLFTTVASYKGSHVAVKKSNLKKMTTDRSLLLQMKRLYELKHANLTTFVGVCTNPEKICTVWEYCNKGSIQDVIENDDIHLDTMFKLSLAVDICQGLDYLHKSSLRHHGNLRSSNCVIDSRWVCKLTDFGTEKFKSQQDAEKNLGEHAFYARLFWTAPENLRKILKKETPVATNHADIYALGIIIKELLCRNEPYSSESQHTPKEIITKVAYPETSGGAVFRPAISDTELDTEYARTNIEYLIQRCWAEDPNNRPSMKAILRTLNKINPYKKSSVVDNMIAMMEKYTNNLEDIVAERTEQLQEEKLKTDTLLYRMLPRKVAEDLKVGRSVQAEAFDSVTIYFSDIVQFTNLASESTPLEIVALLNALYTLFDDIISHYDVYKVETIGDAYMIVSGLPEKNGDLHVKEMAGVSLSILQKVMTFKIPHKPNRQLEIRIGLHTGSVVAGVVGLTMPRYCLFGDTVNTASRMESNGKPLKIHISGTTKAGLDNFPEFLVEERGQIEIKGKGLMTTYWLVGLFSEKEEVCMESKRLDTLIRPEERHNDDDNPRGFRGGQSEGSAGGSNEGKVSVADSGISMDKCVDDHIADKISVSDSDTKEGKGATEQILDSLTYVSCEDKPTKECNTKEFNVENVSDKGQGNENAEAKQIDTIKSHKYPLTEFFCESFKRDGLLSNKDNKHMISYKKMKKANSDTERKTTSDTDASQLECTANDLPSLKKATINGWKSTPKKKSKKIKFNSSMNGKQAPLFEESPGEKLRVYGHRNFYHLDRSYDMYLLDSTSELSTDKDQGPLGICDYSSKKAPTVHFTPPPRLNSTDYMTIHNNWFDN